MTVIKSKSFKVNAGMYTFSGTGAAPTHTAAAFSSLYGTSKTFRFNIKKGVKLKYTTPQAHLPTICPLVYIQYRRVDGGAPLDGLWQGAVTAQLVWDDAA